jgi:hypothetical protein
MIRVVITIVLLTASLNAAARDISMRGEYAWSPDNLTVNSQPPMADVLRESQEAPMFSIEEAPVSAPDRLDLMRNWNLFNKPVQNGFSHFFPTAAAIEISAGGGSLEAVGKNKGGPVYGHLMTTREGDLLWSATVEVDNSHRLRLNLTNVVLPDNARLWVYGAGDEFAGPFGKELADTRGDIWTPSVSGPLIKLVVLLPEGSSQASFTLDRVLEIFELNALREPITRPEEGEEDTSCLVQSLCVDTSTFAPIAEVEKGIGRMDFIVNGDGFNCTGGLINDTDASTTIPYFLTANHCFDNQDVASTLEVYWDWTADGCDGNDPDLASVSKSNGSTLKATGKPSDYLLLQLNAIPAGRYFLGYTINQSAIAPGQTLHRIHNPGGRVHHYSQTRVEGGAHECGGEWTDSTHIWQTYVSGSTLGGSSGSPVLTASAQIVGQLSGSCGELSCQEEPTIDGKLSSYWSEVAQFLDPSSGNPDPDPDPDPDPSSFKINAGLNGSWYNTSMSGQGILVDVLAATNQVFAAWFTFDSVRPPANYTAVLGEAGLRWLTALGPINGNKAELTAYLANGGVFASATPAVQQAASGTVTLTFKNCKEATVDYNLNGVGAGSIDLVRLTFDGVALCESLQ